MAAPKNNGKLRICGVYKVTMNPSLQIKTHPFPKPDDVFATLSGGNIFLKINLSQTYQQIMVDEDSKHLLTINTHHGLYRYNRLPFGVALAPAIF